MPADRRTKHPHKYQRLALQFARNLREIRGEKTVREFADSLSMHFAEWSKFETGRVKPSFEKFLELCDKLHRTPDELIYGNGRAKKK